MHEMPDMSAWTPQSIVDAIRSLTAGDMAMLYTVVVGVLLYFLIRAWRCRG